MSEQEAYRQVQKKVKLRKGFYFHLGIYIVIISFLFTINVLTNDENGDWWFLFPAASWAVALGIHGLTVFFFSDTGYFGRDWEEQQINNELNRHVSNREQPLDLNGTPKRELETRLDRRYEDDELV